MPLTILNIVSAFASILSFLGLAFPSEYLSAVIFILTFLVLIFVILLKSVFFNYPPYTMISTSINLNLRENRNRAKLETFHVIRPNATHLDRISFAGFSADGSMENFQWNDESIELSQLHRRPPGSGVTVQFPSAKRLLKKFNGKLSFEYIDSFSKREEYYGFLPSYPTNELSIEILFPRDKLCRAARLHKIIGATDEELFKLELLENGNRVICNVKRPSFGAKYEIRWTW